jgi:TPR repeat protein
MAADQRYPEAQNAFASLLWDGSGVAKDLTRSTRYFRLAADHSIAESQYCYWFCLLNHHSPHRDIAGVIQYLKLSAENGSARGQFAIACMAETAIGPFSSIDLKTAVRYYERCCDRFPAGAVCLGRCLQMRRGIPVDFTVAAECFKQAADSNNADGVNCFGCCLERGDGVDPDIVRAVSRWYCACDAIRALPQRMGVPSPVGGETLQ